ncbi:type 1 glutamine amidotransferase domain-containing protein [Ammoniphilus sp. YIM 78166]|uniref:type 1 glutamine amidotransferase domain-containing protein n=1 Tax=Ammoniphilus sp. YIM 78166 TaxID=1644106 RepID=UPI00106F3704|nr:type 1 glutamine amidotransferase domain-containing protein [Ammoniphilus sp. YIM 78166]
MARVAFLLAPNFEDSEMKNPYDAIREAGHEATVVGIEGGVEIKGKKGTAYTSDVSISAIHASDFDAVIIPGGSAPEAIRVNDQMVQFVKDAHAQAKPIAGICHGPQVMISADILKGKKSTCYIGIRDDVKLAGAEYVDEEVVVDGNIITSRTPKDEPAFIQAILKQLS